MFGMFADMWDDGWFGRVMAVMFAGLLAAVAFLLYLLAYSIWLDVAHPCIKSHKEWREHPALTQYIYTGKVMVPIFHPASAGWEEICDERK